MKIEGGRKKESKVVKRERERKGRHDQRGAMLDRDLMWLKYITLTHTDTGRGVVIIQPWVA